jgi:hypothetical protein
VYLTNAANARRAETRLSSGEAHPLRRTRPKGDPDPCWELIGWDEAKGTEGLFN